MTQAVEIDLPTLVRNLRTASISTQRELDQLRYSWAEKILSKMIERAPVKTGKLRSSLKITHNWGYSTIGTDLFYAPYVEFGTGQFNEFGGAPYEIKPRNASVLVFTVGGRKVFAKRVIHPGIRPQRFIRGAVEEFLEEIGADTASLGVRMITGGRR